MGFEAPEKHYKLTFVDDDLAGLEVTAAEPSVDELMRLQAMGDINASDPEEIRSLFRQFAVLLVSWNLTRKGKPVPATYEGLVSQQSGLVMRIIWAFQRAVTEPDPTQPPASPDGASPAEESLELASSSRSLPS